MTLCVAYLRKDVDCCVSLPLTVFVLVNVDKGVVVAECFLLLLNLLVQVLGLILAETHWKSLLVIETAAGHVDKVDFMCENVHATCSS